jgi:hypothetical protein
MADCDDGLGMGSLWQYRENEFNRDFFDFAVKRLRVPQPSSAFLANHPGGMLSFSFELMLMGWCCRILIS